MSSTKQSSKFSSTTDRSNMFYWQTDRPFEGLEIKNIFLDRHDHFDKSQAIQAITYGMEQAGKSKTRSQVKHCQDIIVFGSVNVVLKATLNDGTQVIFRAHPPGINNGYFWAESLATQKAKKLGIPTYNTYFIYDQKQKFNFDFMLLECLPGENIKKMWPLSADQERKIVEQTGEFIAKIHTIKTQQYGFFDNQIAKNQGRLIGLHPEWKDHVYAAYQANQKYLLDSHTITQEIIKKLETIFSQNEHLLYCPQPVLIHNDVADWNQLTIGDQVTGIVDWDECFSGDPVMDFAAYALFFEPIRVDMFQTGYERTSPLPDGFTEKMHLYTLRYVISKLTLRRKRIAFQPEIQSMIDHALKTLDQEFKWYGV